MNLAMLLEMAADGLGDRVAVGSRRDGLTYAALLDQARRGAALLGARGVERAGLVGVNSPAVPLLLFAGALAGVPYAPVSYRLADDRLRSVVGRLAPALVVVDEDEAARVAGVEGIEIVSRPEFVGAVEAAAPAEPGFTDPDDIAVLLFTSGTTGEPKAAVLRHRHLTSYVISTVEFAGAGEEEAALVSVPPYHVAGIAAVLSSVYAGRRLVYLPSFSPEGWVAAARDEGVTHAMVVPTMLGRILDVLEAEGEKLPALRHLSYGGGRMPVPVVERAIDLLPDVNLVNAYGLTETSSTIAVLGPDDHRRAFGSDDPAVRARLASVGRPLPSVEVEIRDANGQPVPVGETGQVWVRGEQVSGEYLGVRASSDDGWFPTNDNGRLDDEGYLFVEGRLDDVIVRGAENLSPGEIEDVLLQHPAVAEAAVVGVPDEEWGEAVAAAVVLVPGAAASEGELQDFVRSQLRSSRTPARIDFRAELPYNETGKLLRRKVREILAS